MKKLYLVYFFSIFFFLTNVNAKIDSYKKGDLIFNKLKLNNKRYINLPEGEWEVYYRSTEHAAGMKFSVVSLGKVENNKIIELIDVGYANLAGMYVMYVDPIINEVIFKDPHDGCYERPEYFLLEFYRKGSTHNCFKVGHVDVNKELYNPDDKFNRGYLAPLKRYLKDNPEANLPKIMLGSSHSYFSRTTGGDWILITYVIDPNYLDGPDIKFFTEDTSEYHKNNIERFPKHKKTMDRWISISAKRHLELEKLANSKSTYNLNLEKYILRDNENKISTNKKNNNLVEELNILNSLFKSGSLSKEEFEKAKKKILGD